MHKEAHDRATEVECPHCGQGPGRTCVTTSLNEAHFTHMKRVNLRLDRLVAELGS